MTGKTKLEDEILFFDSEIDSEEKAKRLNSKDRLHSCDAIIHKVLLGQKEQGGPWGLHLEVGYDDSSNKSIIKMRTSWGVYESLKSYYDLTRVFGFDPQNWIKLEGSGATAYFAGNILVGIGAKK